MALTEYKTAAAYANAEFIEKRSRFIASVKPVGNIKEAESFISQIKAEHYDARHNVWAYIINEEGRPSERFSDDGEPQGTAGMPVLEVLRRRSVINTAVVVTRYFGGILLGAPGLVRAYSHTAALGLDVAGVAVMRLCAVLSIKCGYEMYARIDSVIKGMGAQIENRDFAEKVTLSVILHNEDVQRLQAVLTEISGATVEAEATGQAYIKE